LFAVVLGLCVVVLAAFVAVTLRFGVDALIGSPPEGDDLRAMWAFAGSAVAAAVTLIGLFLTRAQTTRTEHRLALDTAVNGLKLLTANDGRSYATRGVVAGAIATLVHLKHPVIAMRSLAACWNDNAVDIPSATWLLSEIFASPDAQAQIEAAAMLDAHAHELCEETCGTFSWPASIEYHWLPAASALPARLRVLRAILRVLVSRPRDWWRDGGRDGWAAALFQQVALTDADIDVRAHAALYIDIVLAESRLETIQTESKWMTLDELRESVKAIARPDPHRRIIMLRDSETAFEHWAAQRGDPAAPATRPR
jgi:hypothetical protein